MIHIDICSSLHDQFLITQPKIDAREITSRNFCTKNWCQAQVNAYVKMSIVGTLEGACRKINDIVIKSFPIRITIYLGCSWKTIFATIWKAFVLSAWSVGWYWENSSSDSSSQPKLLQYKERTMHSMVSIVKWMREVVYHGRCPSEEFITLRSQCLCPCPCEVFFLMFSFTRKKPYPSGVFSS